MLKRPLNDAAILIVDDELSNVRVLEHMLAQRQWDNVIGTTDSRQTLNLCQSLQPDLILLDLMMPHIDGFAVMQQLKSWIPPGEYLPVVILTADMTTETKRKALSAGANDFLTKPFDAIELFLRINNLVQMRFLHLQLQEQNTTLEDKVQERTQKLEKAHLEILRHSEELQQSQIETLDRLAQAAEWRDDDTGEHTRRVGRTSALLAEEIGSSLASSN
jgi:putative two-component system response regulator